MFSGPPCRTRPIASQMNNQSVQSGYGVGDEKQFTVSARGAEQGVVMVTVVVTYQDSDKNVLSHTDSISIQVILGYCKINTRV